MFKNISYGHLGLTNVGAFRKLFKDAMLAGDSITAQINAAFDLSPGQHSEIVREQQWLIVGYTYLRSRSCIAATFE